MTNKELEEMKKALCIVPVTEQDHIDLDSAQDDIINEVEKRVRSLLNRMLFGLPNGAKNDITRQALHKFYCQALHAIYWSTK